MDKTSYSVVDFCSEIISNQNSQEIFVLLHLLHNNNNGETMFACKKPLFVNYVKCERSLR